VRWGVDVILTDVTKTWLDMRRALYCTCPYLKCCYVANPLRTADYDKTGSQYGRYFLWTTPKWYAPFQYATSWASQRYLEDVAGPFDTAVTPALEVNV
jgi:phosphatidylglycerol phospholipase C